MENKIDSKTLAIEIAKILDKKKAVDVRVLKVESLTVLTDYFVIASGTSTTQVGALADEVEYELSQKGIEPYTTEGFDSKNWVLLDYSSVIVHVFVPNTRTYYDLEHLWADPPQQPCCDPEPQDHPFQRQDLRGYQLSDQLGGPLQRRRHRRAGGGHL